VVIDPENPRENLKLDVCSHYVKDLCFLLPDTFLLSGCLPLRGFHIPAPSVEFIYVLAKIFGKNKDPGPYVDELRSLYEKDPAGAEHAFKRLFGTTGKSASLWLATPVAEWGALNRIMRRRHRYGPLLLAREAARWFRRGFRPAGLEVAFLGPDGTGKSTLLSALGELLEPCFRKQQIFHFRPMLLEKPSRKAVTDPHGSPARSLLAGLLKVCYYYSDHLFGHCLRVVPLKIRSTLVLFDRNFNDLLVDQRRYRLRGCLSFAAWLGRLLPSPDMTFILSGTPATIHHRKPELDCGEIERQFSELGRLAKRIPRCSVVSVDSPAPQVAGEVAAAIICHLAARSATRGKTIRSRKAGLFRS
jgi:thymidylate kinase